MTQKFKVLVTRKWPSTVEKKLDENFDVTLNENDIPMTEEQLLEAMNKYDAVWIIRFFGFSYFFFSKKI